MRFASMLVVSFAMAALPFAPLAKAQKWEFGGGAGGGFYTAQDISGANGSASAKLANGLAGSAWLVNNTAGRWGGELRYDYGMNDFALSGGGQSATFAARTQAFHYDVLWYAAPNGSHIRPFVSMGAGVKLYQGTGSEVQLQPLSNVALLTQQQDLVPVASVGGGVKVQMSPRLSLRLELHDYLTPFPKKVITPNVGEKVGGLSWLNDFVPMIGISYTSDAR